MLFEKPISNREIEHTVRRLAADLNISKTLPSHVRWIGSQNPTSLGVRRMQMIGGVLPSGEPRLVRHIFVRSVAMSMMRTSSLQSRLRKLLEQSYSSVGNTGDT